VSGIWEDKSLMNAWIGFDTSQEAVPGLCLVTGREMPLATKHPAKLRNGADKAKLISSNDLEGFTFRGRFDSANQACGVGSEVTQKAHNALSWLIGRRQAYRNGDQAIVAWAVSGKSIPDPFVNSLELFDIEADQLETTQPFQGDVGQAFALRLAKVIAGYRANLGSTNEIVVMSLDSATPGRMAITFYRELTGSEFLERVQAWHEKVVWHQHYSKDLRFVGAPSPKDIAEAAFGRRLDDKLRKATVERLLPCIIDGQLIPRDLVESTIRRSCNRAGLEHWEWEKNLGIACALFRGCFRERNYQMALEPNRITRDYLYGRLLAIAEHVENRALYVAGEKRETSAARLMQRFADRPCSTWRTIELSLTPYKARLRAKRSSFLREMEKQIDGIVNAFQGQDFTAEWRLSGEFLLGYHCQRQALWAKPDVDTDEDNSDN
jgi:CRISPR-associated protein Csd1